MVVGMVICVVGMIGYGVLVVGALAVGGSGVAAYVLF